MSTGTCVRPRYLVITPEQVREGMSAGILVLLINVTCGVMIHSNPNPNPNPHPNPNPNPNPHDP